MYLTLVPYWNSDGWRPSPRYPRPLHVRDQLSMISLLERGPRPPTVRAADEALSPAIVITEVHA